MSIINSSEGGAQKREHRLQI